jgi:hypothetical protein
MRAFSTHRWTAALFAGLLVVGLTTIGQADAGQVVDGNPKCEGFDHSVKYEDPSGTYVVDQHGLHMTLTVGTHPDVAEPNPDNAVLSYTVHASSDVTTGQIIVKGGNGAIIYQFGEAPPLHSPTLDNGKWPSISHVQICWDEPEPEPEYGRVDITKVVTGDDAPTGTEFEICITGPEPATTQQCETVTAGGHAVFEQLEPGTYAVTETDPGTNWTVDNSDPIIEVIADQTATGTVTNTYDEPEPEPEYGRVDITKVVTGDDAPTGTEFEICITGPEPATTQQCETVTAGGHAVFEQLEPGTYAVTETDPGTNWTVDNSDPIIEVIADQTATGTVTNTYDEPEPEPEYGRVDITKVVTGDDAPTGTEFEICITGPEPATTQQCETVTAGGHAVFEQLEPGTYAVTETDPGTNWTVDNSDPIIEVIADQTATGTVTNTYDEPEPEPEYGRVDITKVVTGDDAPTGTEFEICITGPEPATTQQCETVTAGGHAVFEQLEPGTYAVTEIDPGTNWTVGYADDTITVIADQTATGTVTNTYAAQEQLPPVTPPTPTVAPSGGTVTPTAQPESGDLPVTGPSTRMVLGQAGIATALLAIGTTLVRFCRRPQPTAG